jgi:tetratricopeptide (TPR) repeat protein
MGEWYAKSPQLRASVERARELGERLGDEALVAMPLAVIGSAKYAAGRFREAIADLEPAVDVLERQERLAEASMAAGTTAMAHGRLGSFAAADAWLARTVRLADLSGDPKARLDADLAIGLVETERGNLRTAMEHTTSAIEQATETGNVACALVGSFFLGDQHLRLGDAKAAIPALERSSDLAAYCDAGSYVGLSQAWLAAARARNGGDLDAELAALTASLDVARANEDAHGEAEVLRHRATVLAAAPAPDWEAVFADLEAAARAFERLGARPALARTLHDHGMALEVAGRQAEATETLRRAAALFESMAITPAA